MHIDLNYYIFKKYNIRHFVVKPICTDEFCRPTCTPTRCKRYPSKIRMSFESEETSAEKVVALHLRNTMQQARASYLAVIEVL